MKMLKLFTQWFETLWIVIVLLRIYSKKLILIIEKALEGWTSGAQRFLRTVTLLCMIVLWWIHVIIHLFKPIECTAPRVTLDVSYGLWMMTCPWRFIVWNKCTIWWGMVVGGTVWGQGIWEAFVPSVQFCYEPKTMLCRKVCLKKKGL